MMITNALAAHTLTAINALTPGDGAVTAMDGATPTRPPGTEGLTTVMGWILWGGTAILFIYFVFGLVSAGRARRNGDQVEAPIWPMAAAALLGAAGTVWAAIT